MSEEPEFFTYTREEFLDEFVHPDERPAAEEAAETWDRMLLKELPCHHHTLDLVGALVDLGDPGTARTQVPNSLALAPANSSSVRTPF
jgi:hypothetical protein